MNDFEDRLARAVARGSDRADKRAQEARAKKLSEEELKTLHTKYRLSLSEHIESCLTPLLDHFPGFRLETIYGERGWGASVSRDDFGMTEKTVRNSVYSRLELTIRPHSSLGVVELAGKGAVRNKEIYNRTHFRKIAEVDEEEYIQLIDAWVVEFAERFAAGK